MRSFFRHPLRRQASLRHAATRALAVPIVPLVMLACERPDDPRVPHVEQPSYALPAGFDEAELADRLTRAEQAIAAQKPQEAVDLLMVPASQPSVDPRVRRLYGKALLHAGQASLAIWPLERAATGRPADSEEAFLHAQALLAGGDPLTARRVLDRLLEQVPGNPRLLRLRARANRAALDLEAAIRDLETVIGLAPDDLGLREGHVSLLLEARRVDEARTAVAALNARVASLELPAAERARYCASEALFELEHGDPERSRALFARCLETFPEQPNVVLPWCHFLEQTGERERAIEILRAKLDQHGHPRGWTTPLVGRLVAAGRRTEAEALLLEVAEDAQDANLFFQLADHRIEWGDLTGAREAAFRAIALQSGRDPEAPDFDWSALPLDGRFALGDLLIRIGDEATVERLIRSLETRSEAETGDDEAVYPILLKARLALERGASAEALALFEESFRYWPSNVAARYLAGRAAMELGDFDRGLSLYRDAFRAEPTGSDAGLTLARLQLAEGHALSAADTTSTRLGQGSDDPESLLLFAQLASTLSAFESAAKAREDLAKLPAWTGIAHREAALEIARREGAAAAIAHLEGAASLDDPVQYEALTQWVRFRLAAGEADAVFARLDRLEQQGGAAQHRLVRARALRVAGDLELARASAEQAAAQDPSLVEAWLELGALALELADPDRAHAAFAEAHAIEPSNERAAIGLADVALARGERDEAKRLYRKTLVAHPWQTRAALALARIEFEDGSSTDRTLIWSRWAARFGGELRSEAALLLGRIRLARAEPREAIVALQIAASDSSEPSRPLLLLARALLAEGEQTQALNAIQRAIAHGSFASREEAAEATALLDSLQRGARP